MIISTAAEKPFNISTSVYDKKSHNQVDLEGTYVRIIKFMYDWPTANILHGEKLKDFLPRSGTRQGYHLYSV